MDKKTKQTSRGKRIINGMIFLIAVIVFLVAGVKLILIGWNYYSSDKEYSDLQSYVKVHTSESSSETVTGDTEDQTEGNTDSQEFTVDFTGLQKKNPDCIGWIRFPNLDISYPVMQGDDNEYYLTHTFNGAKLTAASIFADFSNQSDFSDDNTFIYGHNMKNKSMFGRLNDYKEESFYKDNPGFYIYTPDYTYYYQIFSCYLAAVEGESDSFITSFASESDYAAYLQKVKERSDYDTGVQVDSSRKMITLMTCNKAGYDYRFLVHAIQTEAIPVQ